MLYFCLLERKQEDKLVIVFNNNTWRKKHMSNAFMTDFILWLHCSSVSGQDEPNRRLWLATPAGKMELSCPLGTTRRVSREKFPRKPNHKYFIDHASSLKMAGYYINSHWKYRYGARGFPLKSRRKDQWHIRRFLNRVKTGTKEQVENFLLPLIRTAENGSDSQNELSNQLEDALAQSDVIEVWKLIAEINETESNKTLENINEVCKTIAERERTTKKMDVISSVVGIARKFTKQ